MLFALEQGMGQHRKSLQCDGYLMEVVGLEAFLVAYSSDIGKGGLCGALFQLLGKTCHFWLPGVPWCQRSLPGMVGNPW
jgi:hypothetical protein